jgi:hypothetical protein
VCVLPRKTWGASTRSPEVPDLIDVTLGQKGNLGWGTEPARRQARGRVPERPSRQLFCAAALASGTRAVESSARPCGGHRFAEHASRLREVGRPMARVVEARNAPVASAGNHSVPAATSRPARSRSGSVEFIADRSATHPYAAIALP